jgi:hypothetical protein
MALCPDCDQAYYNTVDEIHSCNLMDRVLVLERERDAYRSALCDMVAFTKGVTLTGDGLYARNRAVELLNKMLQRYSR